jgi:hypothetical protein
LPPKNPTIASRATPIGSADVHPMKDKIRNGKILFVYAGGNEEKTRQAAVIFESIPNFFSTIASGATPIGSAGRAPDENEVIIIIEHPLKHIIDYLVKR